MAILWLLWLQAVIDFRGAFEAQWSKMERARYGALYVHLFIIET
jgi:hypothetical protein